MRCARLHTTELRRLRLGERATDTVRKEGDVSNDRVERRAKLVGHDREKVRLRTAGRFRVASCRSLPHQARRTVGVRTASLVDDRRENEARQRRDANEAIQMCETQTQGLTGERTHSSGRPPDSERRDEHGAGRRATLLETQRGPDEQRERDVDERRGDATRERPAKDEEGGDDRDGHQRRQFRDSRRRRGPRRPREPRENERRDEENAHRIATPPGEPGASNPTRRHDPKNRESGDTDRGAGDRCDPCAEQRERQDVARPLERPVEVMDSTEQGGRYHGLERIADRREERDAGGRVGRDVGEERAQGHAGPDTSSTKEHRGDGDARGRPDQRHRHADRGHRETELGRNEVGGGYAGHPRHVDSPSPHESEHRRVRARRA